MKNTNKKSYVVAELSANHNHQIDIAKKTILAAKESGADAVKLQTYTADTLTINCMNKYFTEGLNGTIWEGKNFYELYQEAFTPWEWHVELFEFARSLGLDIFSSPFDRTAVDFLESFEPSHYKIASFEIVDIPLIQYVASKNRPIIVSTGIATLADIEAAVQACLEVGNENITLLKCTSSYPAPLAEANLLTIPNMRETFDLKVGLSDHTMGSSAAIAAVALGAKVIEKHFILDRTIGGPDASFSMEPEEFKHMVQSIREVESALGTVNYQLTEKAEKSKVFARSLFIVDDVKAGEIITDQNVRSIRPGYGMHPKYMPEVIGKSFQNDQKRGTPLFWDMIISE
jgi:pseudaminic acid synthase